MHASAEFVKAAKNGHIQIRICSNCGAQQQSKAYFCAQCGSSEMTYKTIPGRGHIVTYTIITVTPDGFEKYAPYAFVVMAVDDTSLRISGFMGGIATPEDLPVGTRAHVTGYDERGLIITKE